MDVAGRAAARSATRFDDAGDRRAARHPAAERPLPHRLHRLGRRCCSSPPTTRCSSPTVGTGRSRPSRSPRPGVDARDRDRRARRPSSARSSRGARPRRRPARARGARVTLGRSSATFARRGSPAPSSSPTEHARRGLPAGEGRGRGRPDPRRVRDRRRRARRRCSRRSATAPTERDFALALEFAMRERGASGNSFDPIVASGPNGAKPHARADATARSSAASSSSSTSAASSTATAPT